MPVNKVKIMGIVNVTPDSFSDGGEFVTLGAAVAQARRLVEQGADIIDIGGESTRPFAEPVAEDEELARVIPVIKAVREQLTVPISIDTTKAAVAEQALEAGADIINDISALRYDPEMIKLVAATTVPVIIMHMQKTPADMQVNPSYNDVIGEIEAFFNERIDWITSHGVDKQRLIIDPGIGFGKSLEHNLTILKHLERFRQFGVPLLLAHSRKRFLGELTGEVQENQRDLATSVVSALCLSQGFDMVRVHDVRATRQALLLASAIEAAS